MCFHQISQISICEQFDTDAIPTLATLALAAGSCNGCCDIGQTCIGKKKDVKMTYYSE